MFRRCCIQRRLQLGVLFVLLVVGGHSGAQPASSLGAKEVATRLDARRETIAAEVTAQLKTNPVTGSYTTVWRQFEELAIEALHEVLPRHVAGLRAEHFDRGTTGREKNRVADLALVLGDEQIEISIKSARRGANPENDMGTFRDHPNRKAFFAAAFTLWVRYDDAGDGIKCERVFFDRTWRLVGKSTLVDGVKYRKKDGNMRPKPWAMFESGKAFWDSEVEFEAAVKRAELFRASALIKEHLADLSDTDQRLLYEKLRQKFEAQE